MKEEDKEGETEEKALALFSLSNDNSVTIE
jgi:hypothetical protein